MMRCSLLFLVRAPLCAQVSKTLDMSTREGSKTHYVVFASRGGSTTGHAFVVWGIEDDKRRQSTIQAFGLYPENEGTNCSSVIRTVPGRMMDEMQNHSVQAITMELIVRVDVGDFKRSLKVARAWDCRREFSLFSRDCVEFVRAVGESLSLIMPSRGVTRWTPQAYVHALLASVTEESLDLEDAVYRRIADEEESDGTRNADVSGWLGNTRYLLGSGSCRPSLVCPQRSAASLRRLKAIPGNIGRNRSDD